MTHLGVIDVKADAARKILRGIQKLAKEKGIPQIERQAKEAIKALK